MRDADCVRFLQWCLPRLGLRWPGYRKVRGTVCKRVGRRLRELGLADVAAYRARLAADPGEWARLDGFCRIPISRFFRDRRVFEELRDRVLPELAETALVQRRGELRCWCAGCASGEEVYTLRLIWDLSIAAQRPGMRFSILGTDADEVMLGRAQAACYGRGSLKDVPAAWLERAFRCSDDLFCVAPEFRHDIAFEQANIRTAQPAGPFDLILCRNLAFTYFADHLQRQVQSTLERSLRGGGYLVLGSHERLAEETPGLAQPEPKLPIYRKPI